MLTRRGFLGATALLLGCGDNTSGGRFAGFTMAIQTWTFRAFPLEQELAFMQELGVARVELGPQPTANGTYPPSADEIAALREQIASHDLACVTCGLEPVGADPDANRAIFDYARALGVRTIGVDPELGWLDDLDALAIEYDLRIAIHNHGPGSHYSEIADVEAALAGRSAHVGCLVDTGHYLRAGVNPIDALRAFRGRVYGVHLKDVAAADPTAPDVILGEGVLDLVALFATLRAIEFPADASLSIEYESNPLAPYDDVAASLAAAASAARASY